MYFHVWKQTTTTNNMITNKYPDPKQGHILINLTNGLCCKTGESWTWRPAPDFTGTRWQYLNLASVWHSGRISADYVNRVESWINISCNCFITATLVSTLITELDFCVLLVLQLALLVTMATQKNVHYCFKWHEYSSLIALSSWLTAALSRVYCSL